MGEASITWLVVILIVFGIRYFFKTNKEYRREYSLDLKIAEEIQKLLKNKKYDLVEEKIKNQELNDITQIIDHLALSLKEKDLLAWKEAKESDVSKLTLGVFYLHFAWITRSHQTAENVSDEKAKGFFEYLELCKNSFDSISKDSFYKPELMSRNIRLYMSLGEDTLATNSFHEISESNPGFLWPFIHYAEFVQPKWGGNIEAVESFYENLPENLLIQSIVTLKLILDSTIMNDNYFKKYNDDIYDFALEKLMKIDTELDSKIINSVHKYVLYNYMDSIADDLRLKDVKKKYQKLMDTNYTIYPYGLLN